MVGNVRVLVARYERPAQIAVMIGLLLEFFMVAALVAYAGLTVAPL